MLAPAGIPVNFTAIFNNPTPAFVAFSVYDESGATPVLVLSPVAMNQVSSNAYSGKFTPGVKNYTVFCAVYTDATFTTLDNSFKTSEQAIAISGQNLTPPVQNAVGVVACEGGSSPDSPNVFTIFRGNAKTAFFLVQDADHSFAPVDLTNCFEIDVALINADGTLTHLLKSTGDVVVTQPPILGAFSAAISAIKSALLNVGEFQNIDVTFTILTEVFTVRYYRAISVFEIT